MQRVILIVLAMAASLCAQAREKQIAVNYLANVPIVFDAQRILIEAEFVRTDGSPRKALVWFNMGMASPVLSRSLYRELMIDGGQLSIRLGNVTLEIPPSDVVNGDGKNIGDPEFAQLFSPYPVEAMLPAKLLLNYAVTLDYPGRRLLIFAPEKAPHDGASTHFDINPQTGLITVDVNVDGSKEAFVLDAGAGYSWARGDVVSRWIRAHPVWRRAEGAVGLSNNAMLDFDFEKKGTLARVPYIAIGAVVLKDVGVLGTGPILGSFGDALIGDLFWDNWQKSAPRPVAGWLGGNALAPFQLTIDYPNHVAYWRGSAKSGTHDVDQVGVTLVRRDGRYFIGGLVRKSDDQTDTDSVAGIDVGDELVAVDGEPTRGAAKNDILKKLGGHAGERHILTVERSGRRLEIETEVTNFN